MSDRRVERVARAICWKLGHNPDDKPAILDYVPMWTMYVAHAEAALQALSGSLKSTRKPHAKVLRKSFGDFLELR